LKKTAANSKPSLSSPNHHPASGQGTSQTRESRGQQEPDPVQSISGVSSQSRCNHGSPSNSASSGSSSVIFIADSHTPWIKSQQATKPHPTISFMRVKTNEELGIGRNPKDRFDSGLDSSLTSTPGTNAINLLQ